MTPFLKGRSETPLPSFQPDIRGLPLPIPTGVPPVTPPSLPTTKPRPGAAPNFPSTPTQAQQPALSPGSSFPSYLTFSERSSPSRVRYAAPDYGAPLTAPGRSRTHPFSLDEGKARSENASQYQTPTRAPPAHAPATNGRERDLKIL